MSSWDQLISPLSEGQFPTFSGDMWTVRITLFFDRRCPTPSSHLGESLEHPQSVREEQEEGLVLHKVEEAEEQRADARRDGPEDVDVPGALL